MNKKLNIPTVLLDFYDFQNTTNLPKMNVISGEQKRARMNRASIILKFNYRRHKNRINFAYHYGELLR